MTHVFVGGAQRSGTTLLATLLCAGPETNDYLGESSSLRALVQTYEFMRGRFPSEGITHFRSRAALDNYYRGVLSSYFSVVLATQPQAYRLVMKEPHLTLYFPHLYRLVPGSRFVLSKRDPRDVVVSMLRVGERMAEAGARHIYNVRDVAEVAAGISDYYSAVFFAADRNPAFARACTWVQYEKLVTDPHTVLDELRAGTGLSLKGVDPMNPGKHRGETVELKDARRLKPWVTDIQAAGQLSTEGVGRYRDYLDADDLLTVEKATCALIKRFGYEFETEEAAELAEKQAREAEAEEPSEQTAEIGEK